MKKNALVYVVAVVISAVVQLIPSHRYEPLIPNEICPDASSWSINPIEQTDSGYELRLASRGFPLEYYNETQTNYCESREHIDGNSNMLLLISNILIISIPVSGLLYVFARRR